MRLGFGDSEVSTATSRPNGALGSFLQKSGSVDNLQDEVAEEGVEEPEQDWSGGGVLGVLSRRLLQHHRGGQHKDQRGDGAARGNPRKEQPHRLGAAATFRMVWVSWRK